MIQAAASFVFLAAACCIGHSVSADQTFATVVWTCVSGGPQQSFARFDLTRSTSLSSSERVMTAADASTPLRCALPWGELEIRVQGYNSPGDARKCGLAEAWGLRVTANGIAVFDQAADSARKCDHDTFDPFYGWVQSDDSQISICRLQSQEDVRVSCKTVWPNDL